MDPRHLNAGADRSAINILGNEAFNTSTGVLRACSVYREAAYLLLVVQHAFSIFLLMVTHIDIPDTPCAVFRSCDHFGGIWRECETQNLAFVSLQFREGPQGMLDCHSRHIA